MVAKWLSKRLVLNSNEEDRRRSAQPSHASYTVQPTPRTLQSLPSREDEELTDLSEESTEARWAIEESVYSDAVLYPLCSTAQGVSWGERNHYSTSVLLLLWNYFMQLALVYLLFNSVGRDKNLPDLFRIETPEVQNSRWMYSSPVMKDTGVCALKRWSDFDPNTLTQGELSRENASFGGNESVAHAARAAHARRLGDSHRRRIADASARRLPRVVSASSRTSSSSRDAGGRDAQGLQRDTFADPIGSRDRTGVWSGALVGQFWLDCRPDMVSGYLTAWRELDTNNDGLWTMAEAELISARLGRLFTNWMAFIRHVSAAEANLQLSVDTQDFSIMPLDVFASQDYLFILCGILDPAKCSTLEERHVLKHIYPHIPHPIDRVYECEEMVLNTCKRILSADFRIFAIRHSQLCGKQVTSRAYSGNVTMKKTEYSEVHAWNILIRSHRFALFIVLILVIWNLAVFAEIRGCLLLAEMLFLFPGPSSPPDQSEGSSDEETLLSSCVQTGEDGHNVVLYFTRKHRLFICFGVFVPRVVIVAFLAHIGSAFLASSQNFEDAIMNSLALTFVLDLDEMLYAGVLAYRRKDIISSFAPLTIPYSIVGRDCGVFSPTLVYGIVILSMAIGFVTIERTMPYGWVYKAEALACFCDLQGPSCTGFWELEAVMGVSNSSAQIEAYYSSTWLPRLPGWVS